MCRWLRRVIWPVAVLMLLTPAGWLATAQAQRVEPRVALLDNGLKLILVERHEQPSVACGVFFDVGSVNDPAGRSGIAHLFEHMLFKGSHVIGTTDYQAEREIIEQEDALREKMDAEMNRMRLMKRRGEIDDLLDPEQWTADYAGMKARYEELLAAERQYIKNNELANLYTTNGGALLNAGTAQDVTMYFVQLPANKLELFFWIESDRMADAVMREFYVERENVREERRLRTESTPTGRFDESFEALFWQAHPYGVPIVGWASEVEAITRDDVRKFYHLYYTPNNARVVLVGDFDADRAIELARRYFGRVPRGEVAPPMVVTEEPRPVAERRFYAEAETNPRLRIRYHTVAIGHKDEAALDVLGELLSGKSGRLYKRLVTQEEAAIGEPHGYDNAMKYAGFFEFDVTLKEGRSPEQVEQFVLQEIDKLREGPISDYELQKVKNQVLAQAVRAIKRSLGLMMRLGLYDTWLDWSYINEAPQRMLAVTADDVRRVVKEYFDPKIRTVAIYVTKEGEPADQDDPELEAVLAAVPAEAHQSIKAAIKRLKSESDLQALRGRMQMMEQASTSDQVPEEQKPLFDYMLKTIKARVAELEAQPAGKELQ